ncbi:MAG: hypothetical protein FJ121_01065 [Deltaproteobacteria bacterium]|nr:hypothetical protein [Deltaproteobacteria bacterium]
MKNKVLLGILVISLVCAWGSVGAAGQIGYSMRGAEAGFGFKPNPNPPSSAVMAFDAIIGRPLGLATTIVGAAVFIPSIPLTLKSDTTSEAAWGLVGRPCGWTFVRPLGRGAPVYEESGVFKPAPAPAPEP